jgi:hypothetical protein
MGTQTEGPEPVSLSTHLVTNVTDVTNVIIVSTPYHDCFQGWCLDTCTSSPVPSGRLVGKATVLLWYCIVQASLGILPLSGVPQSKTLVN